MTVSARSLANVRLKVTPAINASKASQAAAEAGSENSTYMTPLRTTQHLAARTGLTAGMLLALDGAAKVPAGLVVDNSVATAATPAVAVDSAKLRFLQVGAGGVARFLQNKLYDIRSVKDYGAAGDGAADDTAEIQAALDAASAAGGGTVYAPPGTYLVTSTLSVPANVRLSGAGSSATIFTTNVSNLSFVSGAGFYVQICGVRFTYSVTPTGGSVITLGASCFSHYLEDIFILNCWRGINWIGTNNSTRVSIGFVYGLKIYNFRENALNFKYANDIFITNFVIYQKDVAMSVGQRAINQEDNCEAILMLNGDAVGGQYSLYMDAAAPAASGQRPAFNSFVSVYFDSAINGSVINSCGETAFTNCWWSGGREGKAPGLTINECDTIQFIGSKWFNCGSHGCLVNSGSERTMFTNCSWSDNGQTAAAGTAHGLAFAASASGFQVIGGSARNGNYSPAGQQVNGIIVNSGAKNFVIEGVDVRGNAGAGIGLGVALSGSEIVRSCIGFVTEARGVATIPIDGAGVAVAHGLSGTPTTVVCTLKDTGGGAQASGTNMPRVHTIGSANFTYDIGVVASANRPFSWEARL